MKEQVKMIIIFTLKLYYLYKRAKCISWRLKKLEFFCFNKLKPKFKPKDTDFVHKSVLQTSNSDW